MRDEGVVIVGGGLAAQRCAETLRRLGYEGRVRMVCAETEPPYDRPPLSKGVLAGDVDEEDLAYRPSWWYEEKRVELLLGTRATGLDPAGRRIAVGSGAELRYEKLLIATGGGARRLPFLEGFANIHYLRTLAACGASSRRVPAWRSSAPASSARRSPRPRGGSVPR